jgi:hypothetical protein
MLRMVHPGHVGHRAVLMLGVVHARHLRHCGRRGLRLTGRICCAAGVVWCCEWSIAGMVSGAGF